MRACCVHAACLLGAWCMLAAFLLHACCLLAACLLRTCCVLSVCLLRAFCVLAACLLRTCCMLAVCSLRARCVLAACLLCACASCLICVPNALFEFPSKIRLYQRVTLICLWVIYQYLLTPKYGRAGFTQNNVMHRHLYEAKKAWFARNFALNGVISVVELLLQSLFLHQEITSCPKKSILATRI